MKRNLDSILPPLASLILPLALAPLALFCATSPAAAQVSAPVAETPGVQLLRKLVEISSGTQQAAQVNEVQAIVAERLKAMGFSVQLIANPNGAESSGKLLVAERAGKAKRYVTLLAHADTVFEPSSGFTGFTITPGERVARGPGVIDDKGGLVVALLGLERYLKSHPEPELSIRMIASPAEETGSVGFEKKFAELASDTYLVLGFEPGLDDGSIVESRRGNRWYKIQVEGREAHAGRAHKKGINACLELSQKIVEISKLTDYAHDVTVSVGHIEGGQDKFNIVCGKASAKVDTRFSTAADSALLHKRILAALKTPSVRSVEDKEPSKITVEVIEEKEAFSRSPVSKKYIELYLATLQGTENRKILSQKSGGASDANLYATIPGIAIIDGLGPYGGAMHAKEESVRLDSIESRAEGLNRFLGNLEKLK